jgi:hypothetical protein
MAPGPHSWGVQLIDPRKRTMGRQRPRINPWRVASAALMLASAGIMGTLFWAIARAAGG